MTPDDRRILARRPSGATARNLAALAAALDAIGSPVFVIGFDGEILHENQSAGVLLTAHPRGVRRSLVDAVAARPTGLTWDLTPLRGTAATAGFLAILRPSAAEGAGPDGVPMDGDASVQTAALRWRLTARQGEVLHLVARGLTNAVIAATLGIEPGTVEFHLSSIFDKAGVDNRATLIARLLER